MPPNEFRVFVPDGIVRCGLSAVGTNSATMKECVSPQQGCAGCRIFDYAQTQQRDARGVNNEIRKTPALVNAVRTQL